MKAITLYTVRGVRRAVTGVPHQQFGFMKSMKLLAAQLYL
jgi:hypothetical protein